MFNWKKLNNPRKGLIIGLGIFIFLFLLYELGGLFPCESSGVGSMCLNDFQDFILTILQFIGLPVMLLGGTPNYSVAGPMGVNLFWFGNLIWFSLLGLIVGSLIKKKGK